MSMKAVKNDTPETTEIRDKLIVLLRKMGPEPSPDVNAETGFATIMKAAHAAGISDERMVKLCGTDGMAISADEPSRWREGDIWDISQAEVIELVKAELERLQSAVMMD